MQKRYSTLDALERATLAADHRHHPQHQFRACCGARTGTALSALLQVSQVTVYGWFNRWERGGLAGLANAKGQGRLAILQATDRERVEATVRANHQQIKHMTTAVRQELAKSFSPLTLKRFLKRVGQKAALPPRAENGPESGGPYRESGPVGRVVTTRKKRAPRSVLRRRIGLLPDLGYSLQPVISKRISGHSAPSQPAF